MMLKMLRAPLVVLKRCLSRLSRPLINSKRILLKRSFLLKKRIERFSVSESQTMRQSDLLQALQSAIRLTTTPSLPYRIASSEVRLLPT